MNKEYGCDNCGREEVNLFLLPDGREVCEECKKEIEEIKREARIEYYKERLLKNK